MAGEKRVKITPIDADYEQACMRLCFKKWSDIKAEARCLAAQRMIAEGNTKVKELLAKIDQLIKSTAPHERHDEVMRMHREIDRIWADGDKLQRIAFPSAYEGAAAAKAGETGGRT